MHGMLGRAKSSVDVDGKPCTILRMHSCMLDDFGIIYAHYNPKVEYFNLELMQNCPYYVEQYLYEMYKCEHRGVDYSVFRHFRKTRVCQHCGHTIPNVRKCPICGFLRFKIYSGLNEMALFHNILIIIILLIAIFILRAFMN